MASKEYLSYAPMGSSFPIPSLSATINLDEEVRLASTSVEMDMIESLSEIYSIILTLESIEKSYLKDSITDKEYTDTCSRLLKQYKSYLQDPAVAKEFGDLDTFMKSWNVECPKARERIRLGLPESMDQPANKAPIQSSEQVSTALIAATENFITLLDAIKIGMVEKDILHPCLVDIMTSVNKVTDKEFDSKSRIVEWLIKLNQMKASEKLTEEQARQFQFDIQQAYFGFKNSL